jgi:hypothetical protein
MDHQQTSKRSTIGAGGRGVGGEEEEEEHRPIAPVDIKDMKRRLG